jgi:hypothetical protein
VAGRPLRPATRRRLGRPLPHQLADRPRVHPWPSMAFYTQTMRSRVISGISLGFPGLSQSQGQVTHVLLTRSPLEYPRRGLSARLACVKHAASVRPEPGSNSPSRSSDDRPARGGVGTSTHEKRTTLTRTADTNVIRLTKGTHHDRPAGLPAAHRGREFRFGIDNIRHAVEFSRIGRTPARPSGPFSGATHLT